MLPVNTMVDILLVEDNPADAELAIEALNENKMGNKLFWVKDGEQALDFIFARGRFAERENADRPKLILLDLRLPKVDGIEVLRELKANPQTRAIPVVVLTCSKEDRDMIESYRLGVNSYIPKPVKFEEFSATVSRLGYYWLLVNQVPK